MPELFTPMIDRWFRRIVWVAVVACGALIALEVGWNVRAGLDEP